MLRDSFPLTGTGASCLILTFSRHLFDIDLGAASMSDAIDLIESNRKFQVERGKLQLATFQAQVDAEVDLLKARADYMLKLQELVAMQIKNEKDFIQLTWLHLQAREYRRALADAKRRLSRAQKRQLSLQFAVQRAGWLAAGESLEASVVPTAWGAFFALVSNLPFNGRLKLANIRITPEMRVGSGFVRPRYPERACEDVPSSIGNALKVWEWARARSYVPRAGSAVQGLLEASLRELTEQGQEHVQQLRGEVAFAEELLRSRREMLWKEGVVKPASVSVPPKTATKPPAVVVGSALETPDLPPEAPRLSTSSSSSTKKATTKKAKEASGGNGPAAP